MGHFFPLLLPYYVIFSNYIFFSLKHSFFLLNYIWNEFWSGRSCDSLLKIHIIFSYHIIKHNSFGREIYLFTSKIAWNKGNQLCKSPVELAENLTSFGQIKNLVYSTNSGMNEGGGEGGSDKAPLLSQTHNPFTMFPPIVRVALRFSLFFSWTHAFTLPLKTEQVLKMKCHKHPVRQKVDFFDSTNSNIS